MATWRVFESKVEPRDSYFKNLDTYSSTDMSFRFGTPANALSELIRVMSSARAVAAYKLSKKVRRPAEWISPAFPAISGVTGRKLRFGKFPSALIFGAIEDNCPTAFRSENISMIVAEEQWSLLDLLRISLALFFRGSSLFIMA